MQAVSASSKTADCGPSSTSSVISSNGEPANSATQWPSGRRAISPLIWNPANAAAPAAFPGPSRPHVGVEHVGTCRGLEGVILQGDATPVSATSRSTYAITSGKGQSGGVQMTVSIPIFTQPMRASGPCCFRRRCTLPSTLSRAEPLVNRLQVGQHLTRVVQIRQPVDDGNVRTLPRARRPFGQKCGSLTRRQAVEHAGGIFYRLAAAERSSSLRTTLAAQLINAH